MPLIGTNALSIDPTSGVNNALCGVCVGEEFARDLGWALAGVKLHYASTKPLLL
jgi:hypothetical protein